MENGNVYRLPDMAHKILLSCSMLAPPLYLGMDLIAVKLLQGFSFSSQFMSELGAAGSLTCSLVKVLLKNSRINQVAPFKKLDFGIHRNLRRGLSSSGDRGSRCLL
jgi:hypothetical protein